MLVPWEALGGVAEMMKEETKKSFFCVFSVIFLLCVAGSAIIYLIYYNPLFESKTCFVSGRITQVYLQRDGTYNVTFSSGVRLNLSKGAMVMIDGYVGYMQITFKRYVHFKNGEDAWFIPMGTDLVKLDDWGVQLRQW